MDISAYEKFRVEIHHCLLRHNKPGTHITICLTNALANDLMPVIQYVCKDDIPEYPTLYGFDVEVFDTPGKRWWLSVVSGRVFE